MRSWKSVNNHAYLGNNIIDIILINKTDKHFINIDNSKINALPERIILQNSSLTTLEKYVLFYYTKGNPEKIFKISKHILLLHNSWTPLEYKMMSEKEILNKDILLSKLFKKILRKSNTI